MIGKNGEYLAVSAEWPIAATAVKTNSNCVVILCKDVIMLQKNLLFIPVHPCTEDGFPSTSFLTDVTVILYLVPGFKPMERRNRKGKR